MFSENGSVNYDYSYEYSYFGITRYHASEKDDVSEIAFYRCRETICKRNRQRTVITSFLGLLQLVLLISCLIERHVLVCIFLSLPCFLTIKESISHIQLALNPERSDSYKYILTQIEQDSIEDLIMEIDEDIRQDGNRYGSIIVGDNWIWVDFDAKAIRRENISGFYKFEKLEGGGRSKHYYWKLIIIDNHDMQIVALRKSGSTGSKSAREGYMALCRLCPTVPHSEDTIL